MSEVNLIKPVKAKIEQIQKSNTRYDHNRREPVNRIIRDVAWEIDCQVKWFFENDPKMTELGVDIDTAGYIVVRQQDLDAQSKEIKRGDKIIKLANRDVSLFVTKNTPAAQDEAGIFRLLRIFFKDRK